jgi:hypothetical protein
VDWHDGSIFSPAERTWMEADKAHVWVVHVALEANGALDRIDLLELARLLAREDDGVQQHAHHPYKLELVLGRVRVPAERSQLM